MERRLRAWLWLRASFTKHFGNTPQTCLCAAKFWSALMQLQVPSPVRGYWNHRNDPKSQDPVASVLKVSFLLMLLEYWISPFHLLLLIGWNSSTLWCQWVQQSRDVHSEQCRHSPLVPCFWQCLLSSTWNGEIGATLPEVTEEIKDVNRNCICKALALLSHGKALFSSESKQRCT